MADWEVVHVAGRTEIHQMSGPTGGPGCIPSLIEEYGFRRACYYLLIAAIVFSSGIVGTICLPFAIRYYVKSKKDKVFKKKEGYLSPKWFLILCSVTTGIFVCNLILAGITILFRIITQNNI